MINYPEELANYYLSKYEEDNQALHYIKKNGDLKSFKDNLIVEFEKLKHIIFQYEKALQPETLIIDQCYLNILNYDSHKPRISLSLFKTIPYSKMFVHVASEKKLFPTSCFAEAYLYQGYLSLTEKEYFVSLYKRHLESDFCIRNFNDSIQYDIAETLISFISDKFNIDKAKKDFIYIKLLTVYLQSVLILQIIEFIFDKGLEKDFDQCDIFSDDPIVLEKLNLLFLKTDTDIIGKIAFVKEKIMESNNIFSDKKSSSKDIVDFFGSLGIRIY